ncbi:class I SAM-dependent methyltransferase [Alkalihalobacillus sp. AL-G]|uniref:class I SAM-dependent DNA methyltransferase n=1 Tax=Alkalihalobacillus sp. AL-G TaxID=2926399 RepID=UPI00272D9A83|nr:class I SAM-dependent methyltransferase [Alkalihalobacillus sp. AL-G]WLD94760.1 class I SAM-dependent methyltransferase [Alkalihalobacillus sp. AL-G]
MYGSNYYDENAFFEAFQKRRDRPESPNNAIEGPALISMLDGVDGKSVLDLGCGTGDFGAELFQIGAVNYHGVDGSERMIEAARVKLKDTNAKLWQGHLEEIQIQESVYDLIVSRLAFHYLKDVKPLFKKVYLALPLNGRLVFSVQHPVLTASMKSTGEGKRTDWIVDDYFHSGERIEPWINQENVRKYHRTVEQYVTALLEAGFQLEGLKEGTPERRYFESDEEYERRLRIPLVLVLSATKR